MKGMNAKPLTKESIAECLSHLGLAHHKGTVCFVVVGGFSLRKRYGVCAQVCFWCWFVARVLHGVHFLFGRSFVVPCCHLHAWESHADDTRSLGDE